MIPRPWRRVVGALAAGMLLGSAPWMQPATPPLSASEAGLPGLHARSCGQCHPAVAAEWAVSTHAAAWTDTQFQAELHKDPEVGWLCLNCHTPLANQQPRTIVEGTPLRSPKVTLNPSFDATLRDEGVTCLACHWRPEGIASARPGVVAPHPTVHDPSFGRDATCTVCHQATARLEDALVCHFNTGAEKVEAGVEKQCADCHMPAVARGSRQGRSHVWPGSGLSKHPEVHVPGLNGLDVEDVRWGDDRRLTFALVNARAGHKLPSGDPERYLEVRAVLQSAAGEEVSAQKWRIGQTWVWSPQAKQVGDNRLSVGERRAFEWRPEGRGESVRLTVEHVRLSPENLAYHIELVESGHAGPSADDLRRYPTRRTVFEQTLPTR